MCITSFSFLSHASHLRIHQYLIGRHPSQAKAQAYQHNLHRNRHHLQAPFLAKLLQYQTSRLPCQARAQVCQLSHHLNPRYNHLKPVNHLVNPHLNLLVSLRFNHQSQQGHRVSPHLNHLLNLHYNRPSLRLHPVNPRLNHPINLHCNQHFLILQNQAQIPPLCRV